MLNSRALLRFIRVTRCQKLDPVLDTVFGEDEHHTFELFLADCLSLRLVPENCFECFRIGTIVIAVGPYHERCIAASVKTKPKLLGHFIDDLISAAAGFHSYVVRSCRTKPSRF